MKKKLFIILAFWASTTFGQSDFEKYFDDLSLNGSTTIYDYNNKTWLFTDKKDAEIGTLPASTFKIPNSLIAIEYKAIQDENEILEWDGKLKTHLGTVIDA